MTPNLTCAPASIAPGVVAPIFLHLIGLVANVCAYLVMRASPPIPPMPPLPLKMWLEPRGVFLPAEIFIAPSSLASLAVISYSSSKIGASLSRAPAPTD